MVRGAIAFEKGVVSTVMVKLTGDFVGGWFSKTNEEKGGMSRTDGDE